MKKTIIMLVLSVMFLSGCEMGYIPGTMGQPYPSVYDIERQIRERKAKHEKARVARLEKHEKARVARLEKHEKARVARLEKSNLWFEKWEKEAPERAEKARVRRETVERKRIEYNKSLNKLKLGMRSYEVIRYFGYPDQINTSIGSYGTHEQYVYRENKYRDKDVYLYFEDGILTSIQK